MRRLARRFGIAAPVLLAVSALVGGMAVHPAWTAPPDEVPMAMYVLTDQETPADPGDPDLVADVDVEVLDSRTWQVHLHPDDAWHLGDLTADAVGLQVAITLDGELVAAPVIREAITGSSLLISR